MTTYFTESNVDDICILGKIVSKESCENCEYCKYISPYTQAFEKQGIPIGLRIDCVL